MKLFKTKKGLHLKPLLVLRVWTKMELLVRFQTLANLGVASALVALSKNDSKNIKELIARVLNAICKFSELRGIVVQQVRGIC